MKITLRGSLILLRQLTPQNLPRNTIKCLLLCLLVAFGTGCASKNKTRPKEIITDFFSTDIKENGAKLFIYVANFRPLKINRTQTQRQVRGSQQQTVRSMSSIRSDLAERQERLAIKSLEVKFESNGYCRTGYLILNNYTQFDSVEIRGECQESATEADRKLYL